MYEYYYYYCCCYCRYCCCYHSDAAPHSTLVSPQYA